LVSSLNLILLFATGIVYCVIVLVGLVIGLHIMLIVCTIICSLFACLDFIYLYPTTPDIDVNILLLNTHPWCHNFLHATGMTSHPSLQRPKRHKKIEVRHIFSDHGTLDVISWDSPFRPPVIIFIYNLYTCIPSGDVPSGVILLANTSDLTLTNPEHLWPQ
jgi:hypothetical protein